MASSENFSDGENLFTAKCPLCGGPNQCALAADPSATECWCDSLTFLRDLLAKIPDNAVRKICVCQKCLVSYQKSTKVIDDDE